MYVFFTKLKRPASKKKKQNAKGGAACIVRLGRAGAVAATAVRGKAGAPVFFSFFYEALNDVMGWPLR